MLLLPQPHERLRDFLSFTIIASWIHEADSIIKLSTVSRNEKRITVISKSYSLLDRLFNTSFSDSKYIPFLEQRQNKNNSIQSKMIPILKLPRFSPYRIDGEKARQF